MIEKETKKEGQEGREREREKKEGRGKKRRKKENERKGDGVKREKSIIVFSEFYECSRNR